MIIARSKLYINKVQEPLLGNAISPRNEMSPVVTPPMLITSHRSSRHFGCVSRKLIERAPVLVEDTNPEGLVVYGWKSSHFFDMDTSQIKTVWMDHQRRTGRGVFYELSTTCGREKLYISGSVLSKVAMISYKQDILKLVSVNEDVIEVNLWSSPLIVDDESSLLPRDLMSDWEASQADTNLITL